MYLLLDNQKFEGYSGVKRKSGEGCLSFELEQFKS